MNAYCRNGRWDHVNAPTYERRHNCLVVYRRRLRDWFRKSYWAVCIYCDERNGPHRTTDTARAVAIALSQGTRLPAPSPEQEHA